MQAIAEVILKQEQERAARLQQEMQTAASNAQTKLQAKQEQEQRLLEREQRVQEAKRRSSSFSERIAGLQRQSEFLPRLPVPSDGGEHPRHLGLSGVASASVSAPISQRSTPPPPQSTTLNGSVGGANHVMAADGDDDDELQSEMSEDMSYPSQLNPGSHRFQVPDGKVSTSSLNTEYSAMSSRSEMPPSIYDVMRGSSAAGTANTSALSVESNRFRQSAGTSPSNLSMVNGDHIPEEAPPPLPPTDTPASDDEEI